MDCSSLEERRDTAVLIFRERICLMNGNMWVRRVFESGTQVSAWGDVCKKIIGSIMLRYA